MHLLSQFSGVDELNEGNGLNEGELGWVSCSLQALQSVLADLATDHPRK
jgi:hypothetical protein